MKTTYEQARAMYGSDEQMARALFEQLTIVRLDLEVQQALCRRAEDKLQMEYKLNRRPRGTEGPK